MSSSSTTNNKISIEDQKLHSIELSKYSSCDLADALVKKGLAHGGHIPNIVQFSKRQETNSSSSSVAGPAYTVEYAPLDDPRPAVKGGYIDIAPPNSVVVIVTSPSVQLTVAPYTRISNALYGGLMSTRASYLGCAGTVVFGKIRDVAEHNDLGYPVFAYGLGTTAPTKVVKVVAVNQPVSVKVAVQTAAQLTTVSSSSVDYEQRIINPGDYIVADENGVVVLPVENKNQVDNILSIIPPRVQADQLVAQDIKNGQPAGASQKKRRALL